MNRAVSLSLAVFAALAPARALAFGEASSFADSAAIGGAGNRYFTGSPADSYTCAVCHERGTAPAVLVSGLPTDGYVPGDSYEITIDWSDKLEHVGAALEITTIRGRRAGKLRLPDGRERQDPELCAEPPTLAAQLIAAAPEAATDCSLEDDGSQTPCRQVVYAPGCGAQRLRLLWTAPDRDVGRLWFAGSVVSADNDGTAGGDGVTELGRVIASPAREAVLETQGGCSVARARGHASSAVCTWALLLGAWALRRRQRSKIGG